MRTVTDLGERSMDFTSTGLCAPATSLDLLLDVLRLTLMLHGLLGQETEPLPVVREAALACQAKQLGQVRKLHALSLMGDVVGERIGQ